MPSTEGAPILQTYNFVYCVYLFRIFDACVEHWIMHINLYIYRP